MIHLQRSYLNINKNTYTIELNCSSFFEVDKNTWRYIPRIITKIVRKLEENTNMGIRNFI